MKGGSSTKTISATACLFKWTSNMKKTYNKTPVTRIIRQALVGSTPVVIFTLSAVFISCSLNNYDVTSRAAPVLFARGISGDSHRIGTVNDTPNRSASSKAKTTFSTRTRRRSGLNSTVTLVKPSQNESSLLEILQWIEDIEHLAHHVCILTESSRHSAWLHAAATDGVPCVHCDTAFPSDKHYQVHALTIVAGSAGGSTYNCSKSRTVRSPSASLTRSARPSLASSSTTRTADTAPTRTATARRLSAHRQRIPQHAQGALNAQRVFGDVTHRIVVGMTARNLEVMHATHVRADAAIHLSHLAKNLNRIMTCALHSCLRHYRRHLYVVFVLSDTGHICCNFFSLQYLVLQIESTFESSR